MDNKRMREANIAIRVQLLVALLLASATACSTATPVRDSRPEALATRFVGAFNNLDIAAMRDLFAEDATAFLPFLSAGARLNGREAIISALEPAFEAERQRSSVGPPYLHLVPHDIHVQLIGDGAVVSFEVGNEKVFSRRTLVLSRRSGSWLIVHLHASNIRVE